MRLASSLALKWLGGIAAIGGATGGVYCYKAGYFGGSNETKDKENKKVQQVVPGNQSGPNDIPTTDKDLDQQGKDGASNEDAGSQKNPPNLDNQVLPDLQLIEEDGLGLPADCENVGNCTIDKDKIKKVKFQALGDGKDEVKVEGLEDENTISVIVEGDGDDKRYVLNNENSEITLKKGNLSLQLPQGKTRFIDEKKKLKQLEIGNYGLPKICETKKSCKLTSTDLETIKFSDFEDEDLMPVITVEGLNNKKTISLTIEDNKYIFNSPSSVDITKNSTTVQLSQGETEFKVEQGKLKKLGTWEFGLPENCKFEDTDEPKTCILSPRDLKKIKFKVFDNNPTLSAPNNTEKVSLKIEKVEDSSFPDKRKYIFTPQGSSSVTITGENTQSLTLSKGENTFKKVRDREFLVAIPKRTDPTSDVKALDSKIENLGLPKTCTFTNKAEGANKSIECELSTEELKKLKFSGGDVSETTGGQGEDNQLGDPKTYKLKIEESNESQFGTKKIRLTFLNKEENVWTTDLTINFNENDEAGEVLIIYGGSNTEFKINDKNQLEVAWDEKNLSDLVGLKCPKEESGGSQPICTLKDGAETIKVLIGGEAKDFKPKNTSDLEENMTYDARQSDYNQGLKFTLSSSISGTNGSAGEDLTLTTGTYQIKREGDNGWRFTNK